MLMPSGAALAAEECQERQAVRVGIAIGDGPALTCQRRLEPGVKIPAVRQRAALDDTPVIDPVYEQPRTGLRLRGFVDRSKGARGSDHPRCALACQAARSEVRGRP